MDLLDPETIAAGERLGILARYVVEGYLANEHQSPFRGISVEFTQHRPYVSGDDTRHLDWKVLGRTDRYYVKQYEQETNFVAHVLLDGSESMQYGSGGMTKLDYGRRAAACLAYLILRQRDAVAVGVFDRYVKEYLPRTGNLASIHMIMNALAATDGAGETNIGAVLHDVAGQIRRRGIVIIISDLFDDEDKILQGIQHIRFGGSEAVVLQVMDPSELEFPFEGSVEFEGYETAEKLTTRPAEIRQSYLREVENFRARIREGCERQNCHYVLVNTARPLHEVIGGYLAFRARTGRR